MATAIPYTPPVRPRPAPPVRPERDGDFYNDELPPELFDGDEDREELAMYLDIARHIDE